MSYSGSAKLLSISLLIRSWYTPANRLVIMTLVDMANGKPRHIPYRDSKLTYLLQVETSPKGVVLILSWLHFRVQSNSLLAATHLFLNLEDGWLQDSLGGNSKTAIIATISPSSWYVHDHSMSKQYSWCNMVQGVWWECFGHESWWYVVAYWYLSRLTGSCSLETLSTLKFAQRAKFIQNNVSS